MLSTEYIISARLCVKEMRPVIDIFGPIVGDARGVCTTKGKGAQAPRQKTTTNVSTRLVKHGIG